MTIRNKNIVIREYDFLHKCLDKKNKYWVDKEPFDEIETFVLDNQEIAQYLKITTKKGYGKVLQAQNYVGIIQTKDGMVIEILPKIARVSDSKDEIDDTIDKDKDILINMLRKLKNSPFKKTDTASMRAMKMPILEIFISMFLDELSMLIKKGLKADYINVEENKKYLKGKLLISKQIKHNYIHKERFYVDYQEVLTNRIENRLIKSTLLHLYKQTNDNGNLKRLREYLFVFDEIDASRDIINDFGKVKLGNRQMKDYLQVLILAKIFLLGNSFTPYKGKSIAYALLFDMNMLFESYVASYLKSKGLDVTFQDTTHYLAYAKGRGEFRLKPDIVIEYGNNTIVADTKWKILDEGKGNHDIHQSDMYQLYAYGTKYKNCKNMFLIFPKHSIEKGNEYCYFENHDKELNLKVLFYDLAKDFHSDDFIENLNSFAKVILK